MNRFLFPNMLVLISCLTIALVTHSASATPLPTVGGDSGTWGTILNDYLKTEHTATGGHKNITTTGNVGIMTSSPETELDVHGVVTVGENNSEHFLIVAPWNQSKTGSYAYISARESKSDPGTTGLILQVFNSGVANNNAFAINSSGYVGIGTNSPEDRLHVVGSVTPSTDSAVVKISSPHSQLMMQDTDDDSYTQFSSSGNVFAIRMNKSGSETPILTLRSGGNVGIGEFNPHNLLTLSGGSASADSINISIAVTGGQVGDEASLLFESNANRDLGRIVAVTEPGYLGNMRFYTASASNTLSEVMRLTSSGDVGIGTTTPGAYKLNVQGTLFTSGGCTGCSDARWKENVTQINDPLGIISMLNGVSFNWKVDEYPEMFFENGTDFGLIAQDVEKVLPEIVYEDGGYKYIRYDRLAPLLIEGVKEIEADNERLKSENQALRANVEWIAKKYAEIDKRLAALESQQE